MVNDDDDVVVDVVEERIRRRASSVLQDVYVGGGCSDGSFDLLDDDWADDGAWRRNAEQ